MSFIDVMGQWVWVAGLALGITTALVGVVYMLSEFLMNDKMKTWAKSEFAEIFYSAIIISLIITGVPLVDQVVQGSLMLSNTGVGSSGAPGCSGTVTSTHIPVADAGKFIGGKSYTCLDICNTNDADPNNIGASIVSPYHDVPSCHVRLGMWFMRELFEEGKYFAFDTYLSYIKTSMISEFTINIEFMFEKAGFFTFTPWKGFFTIGNKIKEMCFDWTIKVMMVDKFQEVLLRYIATALFPSLLVIGGILRTFSFTRKLGGLLLAMAIALYFIFPAFYAFGALILLDMKNDRAVQSQWLANSDANPDHTPDPMVINTMYIKGTLAMPGGSGTQDYQEMKDRLKVYEGMSSDQYMKAMEGRPCDSADPMSPCFDLSSQDYKTLSDPQKEDAMKKAWASADSWFGSVSKESKIDKFVSFAWEKNGPVDIAARLTFWSMFFSLFGVLGTIAGIRSLSVTFGGDIEIAGLTRLI
jgi:hypothetical protein